MADSSVFLPGRLVVAYFRANLASAMEYRAAFVSQSLGMMLNNTVFFVFWWAYFERFRNVGGWTLADMVMLYGLVAAAIGAAVVLFGNCTRLPTMIAEGHLDYCLALPGPPLLHLLASRMSLSGWGDLTFGAVALAIGFVAGAVNLPLALVFVVIGMAVGVGYLTLLGSLAFFMGHAQATVYQGRDSLINFSLYPSPIFQDWTRVLLLTVVPAAYMSHVPVELLRDFDWAKLALMLAFTALLWSMAIVAFRLGLRRYESGNLITLRS